MHAYSVHARLRLNVPFYIERDGGKSHEKNFE